MQDLNSLIAALVRQAVLDLKWELEAIAVGVPDARDLPPPLTGEESDVYDLTPQEQEWAARAALKYARAQEKQWRRWNEAMYEKEQK